MAAGMGVMRVVSGQGGCSVKINSPWHGKRLPLFATAHSQTISIAAVELPRSNCGPVQNSESNGRVSPVEMAPGMGVMRTGNWYSWIRLLVALDPTPQNPVLLDPRPQNPVLLDPPPQNLVLLDRPPQNLVLLDPEGEKLVLLDHHFCDSRSVALNRVAGDRAL